MSMEAKGTLKPGPGGGPPRGGTGLGRAGAGAGGGRRAGWAARSGGRRHDSASQRRSAVGRCGCWHWRLPCCWRGLRPPPGVSTADRAGGRRLRDPAGGVAGARGSGLAGRHCSLRASLSPCAPAGPGPRCPCRRADAWQRVRAAAAFLHNSARAPALRKEAQNRPLPRARPSSGRFKPDRASPSCWFVFFFSPQQSGPTTVGRLVWAATSL